MIGPSGITAALLTSTWIRPSRRAASATVAPRLPARARSRPAAATPRQSATEPGRRRPRPRARPRRGTPRRSRARCPGPLPVTTTPRPVEPLAHGTSADTEREAGDIRGSRWPAVSRRRSWSPARRARRRRMRGSSARSGRCPPSRPPAPRRRLRAGSQDPVRAVAGDVHRPFGVERDAVGDRAGQVDHDAGAAGRAVGAGSGSPRRRAGTTRRRVARCRPATGRRRSGSAAAPLAPDDRLAARRDPDHAAVIRFRVARVGHVQIAGGVERRGVRAASSGSAE